MINVSEGRDGAVLAALDQAAGGSLRDRHSDVFHNRSVFTMIDDAPALAENVRSLVTASFAALDLSRHEGAHPRLGVVDVVPFVALAPESFDAAVRLRDETAAWIARTHEVPVFLYGPTPQGERTLPYVRAHAFVDLGPDLGPALADPRRGASAVGARPVLVAWNLWLRGTSLDEARRLARLLRRPGLRTLGLRVGDDVQVSCNLVDLDVVSPSQVYDLVATELRAGRIDHAELVGLLPRALLDREDPARWAQLGLSADATIESRTPRRS